MTIPDFRVELERLVNLYYALGGDWSPHGYTDTWNDALASARIALATPPPKPPTDEELWAVGEDYLDDPDRTYAIAFARAALEKWGNEKQ